jgi:hypothetical protein
MTSISEEMLQYIIHSESFNGITTKYLRFGINIIIIIKKLQCHSEENIQYHNSANDSHKGIS